MKTVERSPIRGTTGPLSIGDRITGMWRYGSSWNQDLAAQDLLVSQLSGFLENSYTLIRNVALPTLYLPVPCTLIGPTGARVIFASGLKGIFRARGDAWAELDARNRRYVPYRPNLIRRVALMGQALREYLASAGLPLEHIEPVLFFAQPGIHVESIEPAVHLLQTDDLERYTASLRMEEHWLDSTDVQRIVDLLTISKPRAPETSVRQEISLPSEDAVGVGKMRMKPWQWLVIGVMIVLWLVIIIFGTLWLLST
jgi:hypothetical protein